MTQTLQLDNINYVIDKCISTILMSFPFFFFYWIFPAMLLLILAYSVFASDCVSEGRQEEVSLLCLYRHMFIYDSFFSHVLFIGYGKLAFKLNF